MEAVPSMAQPSPNQAGVFPNTAASPLPKISSVTTTVKPWPAIFSIIGIFISLTGTFILYFSNVSTTQRINLVNNQINEETEQINSEPLSSVKSQVTRTKSSITGYKAILQEQLDYSLVLANILKYNPDGATVDTFSVDEKGLVTIIERANDFITTGKSLFAYRQSPVMSNVTIEGVSFSGKDTTGSQVNFTIKAILDKSAVKNLEEGKLPSPSPGPSEASSLPNH